jgi:hypothetical protein
LYFHPPQIRILSFPDSATRWQRRGPLIVARAMLDAIKDQPFTSLGRSVTFARQSMRALCAIQRHSRPAAAGSLDDEKESVEPSSRLAIPPPVPAIDR